MNGSQRALGTPVICDAAEQRTHCCHRAGSTRSRDRLLAAQGWRVLSVPYWEWEGLADARERQAYLRFKLPAHVLQSMG